jgi:hypothetical protein
MGRRLRRIQLLMILAGTVLPAAVHAQGTTADGLFRDGRQLIEEGKVEEGCDKLAESQRLEPSSGTLMNLAYCHAQLGRVATAWAEFLEAERQAIAGRRPDRAQEARRQAAALEARLPRITIRMAKPLPNMTLRRNDRTLGPLDLGAPSPVDPGRYTVTVEAPGYVTWSATLQLDGPGERVLEIPPLVRERATAEKRNVPQARPRPKALTARGARTPGGSTDRKHQLPAGFWISAGTAAAAASAASVFGLLSLSSYNQAEQLCPAAKDCEPEAVRLENRAHTQATITNAAWVVAALAAGVSVFFYFDSRPQRSHVTSSVAAAD